MNKMNNKIKACPRCGGNLVGTHFDDKCSAYISRCSGCDIHMYEYIDKPSGETAGAALVSPNIDVWVDAKVHPSIAGGNLLELEVIARPAAFKENGTITLGKKAALEDCLSYAAKAYNAATKLESPSVIRTLNQNASSQAVKKIVIDLTDWSKPYPTGAIAYDSNDSVIDSAYCDNADEFAEFFDTHREEINSDTELVFKISAGDFDILELEKLVYSIRDAFWKILEGGNNNEI